MAHVAKYKKDTVAQLVSKIKEYPIVGALNLEGLPAPALQKMRAKLRGKAEILMTKRRLMKIALDQIEAEKKGIAQLKEKLLGMPALLFTKDNPFAIYKTLKQSKSPAPAKAGQTAPKDIEIKAGATPFMPGPIIGELGSIGLKTGVEGGKVAIKEDKIVAKEGDEINANLASLLTRLGIEPMEIGLDLVAVYEDGTIYDRKILDIDEDQFMADLETAAVWARNLAMEAAYPTKDTIMDLLIIAVRDTKGLASGADILTKETAGEILGKAERQMLSLKSEAKISDEAPKEEAKPEEKAEEPKAEEKPEEKKEEAAKEEPSEEKKDDQTQQS